MKKKLDIHILELRTIPNYKITIIDLGAEEEKYKVIIKNDDEYYAEVCFTLEKVESFIDFYEDKNLKEAEEYINNYYKKSLGL